MCVAILVVRRRGDHPSEAPALRIRFCPEPPPPPRCLCSLTAQRAASAKFQHAIETPRLCRFAKRPHGVALDREFFIAASDRSAGEDQRQITDAPLGVSTKRG